MSGPRRSSCASRQPWCARLPMKESWGVCRSCRRVVQS
jgi:hypothetical protein